MRVTSEMMVGNSLRRLSTRLSQYEQTQSRMATGRRILRPSDDPSGTGRALALRGAVRSREQEARNAADASSWLDVADSQLQAAVERIQRVRDLAVRGASDVNGDEGRALATEVTAIRDELLGIANATHRGRPLFAGYGGGDAVAADGSYQGTSGADGAMTRRVGDDEVVRINVTADEVFGLDDDATNVFRMLDRLSTALTATDSAAVSAGLDELDAALSTMGQSQALVGVNANRVDSALRRSVDSLQVIRTQLSEVEDVDIAEAVMELQVQELAYQATLEALSRALPPSLVSFLR